MPHVPLRPDGGGVIVCLIVPDFPTVGDNRHRHGIGTQSEMIARAWLSVGAEVHVVWYGPASRLLHDEPVVPVQLHRVPVPAETRMPGAAMLVAALTIARTVRRLDRRARFDAIEAVNDEGYLLGCALALGPRLHLRLSTSLDQNLRFRSRSPSMEERASALLTKLTLRCAGNLVTHSSAQAEAMRHEMGSDRSIAIVPLGVLDPGLRTRVDDGVVRIGYLGKLNARKGIDVFLQAVALLPPSLAEIVVVGKEEAVPAGYASWPSWAERSLKVSTHRLDFLGALSDAELEKFWNSIDVAVVPSRWESFGLVAVEAMARGVPVVTSDGGALPEVVGDAGVIVPAEDPESLSRALLRLARETELRADLGTRGRERYEREYTLRAFADRMRLHFMPGRR